jgi:hypothetical protein
MADRPAWLKGGRPIVGGIAAFAAHLMSGLHALDMSLEARAGGAQWFAESVATFGLVVTILAGLRFARHRRPGSSA